MSLKAVTKAITKRVYMRPEMKFCFAMKKNFCLHYFSLRAK